MNMPPAPRPTLYREISDVLQPVGLIEDTLGLLVSGARVDLDYIQAIGRATAVIRSQVQSLLTRVYDEAVATRGDGT